MLNIDDPRRDKGPAFVHLGFRPFFLLAGLLAVAAMGLWALVLFQGLSLGGLPVSGMVWHGHEMVFGYAMAVIAGFLLTAAHNWTQLRTLNGVPLLGLAGLWLLARIGWLWPLPPLLTAAADLSFGLLLTLAIFWPLARTRQWQHLGMLIKVLLLTLANGLFYLGALDMVSNAGQWGLLLGFYLVVALIMAMGRRVIPFFIEKGVGCPFQAKNWRWLDISSLYLFLIFAVLESFGMLRDLSSALAGVLMLLHGTRLWGWYTPAIWSRPLLWVLFTGYGWLVAGFALRLAAGLDLVSPFIALHAFAVGGIGLVTVGMMARVSLGHTGRSVFEPPRAVSLIFLLILGAALARVFAPLLMPDQATGWLLFSQLLWILGFGLFLALYAPMLVQRRIDGRWG